MNTQSVADAAQAISGHSCHCTEPIGVVLYSHSFATVYLCIRCYGKRRKYYTDHYFYDGRDLDPFRAQFDAWMLPYVISDAIPLPHTMRLSHKGIEVFDAGMCSARDCHGVRNAEVGACRYNAGPSG